MPESTLPPPLETIDEAVTAIDEEALLSKSPTIFSPFRFPVFLSIWTANLFSNMGGMIQTVAAGWLMTDLTREHRYVALVQASNAVPIMLFGLIAGAVADNHNRRNVMLASQIAMLVVSALLTAMSFLGTLTPWLLLFFTMSVGIGAAFNQPAQLASVRLQVGRDKLPEAIALNSVAFNLARCTGPALGGIIIAASSSSAAFAVNTISYVGIIIVLVNWRPDIPKPVRHPILPAIASGLRYCATDLAIRRIVFRGFSFTLGAICFQALAPAVVRDQLHGSGVGYGLLLSAFGIGSICAAFLAVPLRRKIGTEGVVSLATFAFIVAQLILASTHMLGWGLLAAFIAGTGWVSGVSTIAISMQMRSPEHILGRCLSTYQTANFGGMALGAWLWGSLSDLIGLPNALHVATAYLVLVLIASRRFLRMPAHTETLLPLAAKA